MSWTDFPSSHTRKPFISLFPDDWPKIASLNRGQRGTLLTAIFANQGVCEMPEMDQATECIFEMVKRKNSSSCSRDERVREQTRERVRRFRARKKAAAAGTSEAMEEAHHADGV